MADIRSDYLSGADSLRSFYQYPLRGADYGAIIEAKKGHALDRDGLANELLRQNRHLPKVDATLARIESLRDRQTFTVTTGHQLVLMAGPMYTLYKIAHTIQLAAAIQKKHPDYKIVPIFWMATEDHDWEEINHFQTAFQEKHVYAGHFAGPVGRHVLEDSITAALPGNLPEMLKGIFVPGRNYADAFRSLIHRLFGHTGLVIMDADSAALKRMFLPGLGRELEGQGMYAPIAATNAALEAKGYKRQIYARPINLFYIGDGERHSIESDEEGFSLKGAETRWTRPEMFDLLKAHPEHFSPNVAARPLFQESILPNLTYIGGWAEMAYWMQLKAGFEAAGVNFPLLVPRMSATLLRPEQAESVAQLGFEPQDLDTPLHILQDELLKRTWSGEELNSARDQVISAYDNLISYLEGIDPTLAISVRAEQAKSNKSLDRLDKKVRKAKRNQNPAPFQQIKDLKSAIAPENTQQQRSLNLTAFSSISPIELAQLCLDHCQPEEFTHQWITLP